MPDNQRGPFLSGGAAGQVLIKDVGGSNRTIWTDSTNISRETVNEPRTYYVSPTGNNANDGLSAASPFKEIQYAMNLVSTFDVGKIGGVTIQLVNGIHDPAFDPFTMAGILLRDPVGAWPGACVIRGDPATPTNVVITNAVSNNLFLVQGIGSMAWKLDGIVIRPASVETLAIFLDRGAHLECDNVQFNATPAAADSIWGFAYGDSFLTMDHLAINGTGGIGSGFAIENATVLLFSAISCAGATITIKDAFLGIVGAAYYTHLADWSNIGGITGKKFDVALGGLLIEKVLANVPGTIAGTISGSGEASNWPSGPAMTATENVVVQPAGGALTNLHVGYTFSNEGAVAISPFILPTAVPGLEYSFYVSAAVGIRVTCAAGDNIRVAAAVSAIPGKIEATAIGNFITLKAVNATNWVATSVVGTWTPT